jgi:hypothetical protein
MLKSSSPTPRLRNSGVLSVIAFIVERREEIVARPKTCCIRSACRFSPIAMSIVTPTFCALEQRRQALTH